MEGAFVFHPAVAVHRRRLPNVSRKGRRFVGPVAVHVSGQRHVRSQRPEPAAELPLRYDASAINRYWNSRLGEMTERWKYFLGLAVPFGTKVLQNFTAGTLRANEAELARDLRDILEKMGPTFVKLGQVLSIRPDIVGEVAMKELQGLQDAVRPFPNEEAFQVIEEELGVPPGEIFTNISSEPVAAASLAQVYKAQLKSSGQWVAIKVQRPGLLPIVTKDLYVMKKAAEWNQSFMTRFTKQRTDYVALLEAWAVGFYQELDFGTEANNQIRFAESVKNSQIVGVKVPQVYSELCSRRLLVTGG